MIHEVDESLRALVRRDVLNGSDVEVMFEAPTKEWAGRRNAPTIDIYLYDVREDLRRRHLGEVPQRADDGHVTARRPLPRWFKLSYLITAWTQRPEDEHRLLSSLLICFLRTDSVPRDLRVGSLADVHAPIPLTIALPPPEDRALSDVWSALGGELKPSLDLVVIAPFDLERAEEAGPPVRDPLALDVHSRVPDLGGDERAGGRRGDGSDGADGDGDGDAPKPKSGQGAPRRRRRRPVEQA